MNKSLRNSLLYLLAMTFVIMPVQVVYAADVQVVVAITIESEPSMSQHCNHSPVTPDSNTAGKNSPCCDNEQCTPHACNGAGCDECSNCAAATVIALLPTSLDTEQKFKNTLLSQAISSFHHLYLPQDKIPPRYFS